MILSPPINSFDLFGLTIHFYGLILGLSLITTYLLAQRWAPRHNLSLKLIDQLYLFTIPIGIIGARIYHVISNWDYYQLNLSQTPAITNGGLGILGGIVFGLTTIWLIAKRHHTPLLTITNFLAPLLALGQSIGRWGNYVNQELYGLPTSLPWALNIDPANRLPGYQNFTTFHPLFLYESLLNLLNFFIIIKFPNTTFFRTSNFELRTSPTALYFFIYGLIRFSLEFLKIDPDTTNTLLGLKTAQYLSLIMILAGITLSIKRPTKT